MDNKQEKIISMFNDIAPSYDKSNKIMSMGIDKSWRNKAVNLVYNFYAKKEIASIVDVACGTGDMMKMWKVIASKKNIQINNITGIDLSKNMIKEGKKKLPNMKFILTNATELPLEDNTIDILSIAYGIRNVIDREKAFKEFYRVLKPGGILTILEFTKGDKHKVSQKFRNFYMNNIIPIIGGFISKNKEAYQYLPNSISGFINSKDLIVELENNKFEIKFNKGYFMNMSSLFIAVKNNK